MRTVLEPRKIDSDRAFRRPCSWSGFDRGDVADGVSDLAEVGDGGGV
jgi:hypothetical protein